MVDSNCDDDKNGHAISDRMFPSISYTVFIQP